MPLLATGPRLEAACGKEPRKKEKHRRERATETKGERERGKEREKDVAGKRP